MRQWVKRVALGVGGVLVLAGIGLASWEPLTAERAAPPPEKKYDSIIARDSFGVPHIFGRTDPDVAYGIAYAHAEDDFSTLQDVLAMTRGRLGAITGADGAATDYVVHLLGARATVERDYDKQPADIRALLDGYATGLNRYAEQHPDEVKLTKLFPVNGRDIATGFVLRSPFFTGLDRTLAALAQDNPPPADSAGPVPDAPNITPVGPNGEENGSNAFVIAPKRSADGFTRLISNSHQPYEGGVAWWELVVHSGTGWHFAGALFPGAPYPLLGHNRTLGWTNTVNRPDIIDVYKLAMTDADHYRFDGKPQKLARTRVWLPVKLWGPFVLPVPRTVARAIQGPVIENKNGAFAVRYGGADQLKMVEEYYRLNRARDFAEWQKALSIQGIPGTNFLYADAKGNIAYFYNAAFPNRKAGHDYAGVLPGDTSAAYAPGIVPFAQVPRLINPGSGFIINANNTPFQAAGQGYEMREGDWPKLLGVETDTTNRGTRSLELMGEDPSISRADIERIKYDTAVSRQSWAGKWFQAVIDAKYAGEDKQARDILAGWDWNYDGKGRADALALIVLREGNRWHNRRLPQSDPAEALRKSAAHLKKHFGRLDPPMGDVLRLRQGPGKYAVDLPMDGGPDVLRAAANWDEDADGRLAVKHGDSFIMFVEWDKAGRVKSESIQPFGAASTRPESPHYTDQAPLFVAHKLKPVHFDPKMLRANAKRIYRP